MRRRSRGTVISSVENVMFKCSCGKTKSGTKNQVDMFIIFHNAMRLIEILKKIELKIIL